eukprot:290972-Amphidinium_carterae.1
MRFHALLFKAPHPTPSQASLFAAFKSNKWVRLGKDFKSLFHNKNRHDNQGRAKRLEATALASRWYWTSMCWTTD